MYPTAKIEPVVEPLAPETDTTPLAYASSVMPVFPSVIFWLVRKNILLAVNADTLVTLIACVGQLPFIVFYKRYAPLITNSCPEAIPLITMPSEAVVLISAIAPDRLIDKNCFVVGTGRFVNVVFCANA